MNAAAYEAVNFYVWDCEQSAKAFFTDEVLDGISALYGAKPRIQFVHVTALVENTSQ